MWVPKLTSTYAIVNGFMVMALVLPLVEEIFLLKHKHLNP